MRHRRMVHGNASFRRRSRIGRAAVVGDGELCRIDSGLREAACHLSARHRCRVVAELPTVALDLSVRVERAGAGQFHVVAGPGRDRRAGIGDRRMIDDHRHLVKSECGRMPAIVFHAQPDRINAGLGECVRGRLTGRRAAVAEIPEIFDDVAVRIGGFGAVEADCLTGRADARGTGIGDGRRIHLHGLHGRGGGIGKPGIVLNGQRRLEFARCAIPVPHRDTGALVAVAEVPLIGADRAVRIARARAVKQHFLADGDQLLRGEGGLRRIVHRHQMPAGNGPARRLVGIARDGQRHAVGACFGVFVGNPGARRRTAVAEVPAPAGDLALAELRCRSVELDRRRHRNGARRLDHGLRPRNDPHREFRRSMYRCTGRLSLPGS
jgi:hypothetical protein